MRNPAGEYLTHGDGAERITARNVLLIVRQGGTVDDAARELRLPVREVEDVAVRLGLLTPRDVGRRRIARGQRAAWARVPRRQRSAIVRKGWRHLSPEERAERVRRAHRSRAPQARDAQGHFAKHGVSASEEF